jgi:hypothetical protein
VRIASARHERVKEGGSLLTVGASGSITNDQRLSLSCLTALRLMACLALVASYSRGEVVVQQL